MNKRKFYEDLSKLPREELIRLVEAQDPQLLLQVNRIEWVFANKLRHLTWPDGSRVEGRPVTNLELAYLIDPPFQVDSELIKAGFTAEEQRKIHIASDPVMWAREYVNQKPRAYQIWILRDPSPRRVLRAGRRLGKALSLDTPIPSPDGWTTMGALQPGDRVYDESGKPCIVNWISPIYTDHLCYRVVFDDGSEIVADGGHKWKVHAVEGEKIAEQETSTLNTQSMHDRTLGSAGSGASYAVPRIIKPDGEEVGARKIVKIERVEAVPVKCIEVSSGSHLFLAGENMVPTHNSHAMSTFMLHWAFTKKGSDILVMAPVKEQAGQLYKAVLAMCKDSEMVDSAITRRVTSPQYKLEFSNGSIISFFTTGMKSGGKCLTGDHDVLSESGWKSIKDVATGERILSWKDGELSYQRVTETHSFHHSGEMVEHRSGDVSFTATPNHKFAAKSDTDEMWGTYMADELGNHSLPTGGRAAEWVSDNYSKEDLEIWGRWIADGSRRHGDFIHLDRWSPWDSDRTAKPCEILGLECEVSDTSIKVAWSPPTDNKGHGRIPRDIMGEKNALSILDGLLGYDGWRDSGGFEYVSESYELAEDIQELSVRVGLNAKLSKLDGATGGWVVSVQDKSETVIRESDLRFVDYDGMVYCVTVPDSGFFVTRRDGRVHVTGNSDTVRGQEADLIVLDEMDYMGPDDLTAIYVMLQETGLEIGQTKAEGDEKVLIAASTPTGLRGKFWEWCNSPNFKEFWFPSLVNPSFNKATEDEFREEYDEMDFRHEIEADWGESADGVYARKYVDLAFLSAVKPDQDTTEEDLVKLKEESDWDYENPEWASSDSKFVMGVDWDKFGAGPNICVLEIPGKNCEDPRFEGRARVVFREEIKRSDFVLIEAVERIIYLNSLFKPDWIYVDRGFGDVQIELLHSHGIENPSSGLKGKVKGISFGGSIEVRDPATKLLDKKPAKPFMVENLRWMLERNLLVIPSSDEQLWEQLTHYVVYGFSSLGSPRFQMADPKMPDHAHDALMLACLAYKQNYDSLMKERISRKMITVPSELVLPPSLKQSADDIMDSESVKKVSSNSSTDVVGARRQGSSAIRRVPRLGRSGKIHRKMF